MNETTEGEGHAINDRMAEQLERRRRLQPERRQTTRAPRTERRRICSYCFQHGDHRTVAQCLRALERPDRILRGD
jgi:hypothetical protein